MYTLDDIREDYKWQRELERRNCTIKISQRDYLRISHRDWGLPTGTYVGRIWRWFDKDNKPRITEICYNSVEDIPVGNVILVKYFVEFDDNVTDVISWNSLGDFGYTYDQLSNQVYKTIFL